MSGIAASLLPNPAHRWDRAAAQGLTGRDEVLFRAHLVGADPALTKEGGGNFSAKGTAPDHLGRPTDVLWMSAWGCDGATTTADDFPALRLDDLRALRDCGPLEESEMIDRVLACGLRGEQPRPGIETLTHAFIRARHVDHCHPDAVITLTSIPDGRRLAEEEFGDEAIWFDYRQFDIGVARELADRIDAQPGCRFVLLANHGLFTWADTSEECYLNSLEAVARATSALDRAIHRTPDLGGTAVEAPPRETATELLAAILPPLRGALSAGTPGLVLHTDRTAEAVAFSSSARGPALSQAGPACPDHLVTVGYRPLVLGPLLPPGHTAQPLTPDAVDEAVRAVLEGVAHHRKWYDGYYEHHITEAGRALGRRSDAPRAIVLPGIGVVTSGSDAAKARLCADHFGQTMTVVRAADAAGGYTSLSEAQGAADEYWPLMRFKPQLRSSDGPLAGRVVLLTGVDDDRTAALAALLAAEDAHVALAGDDPARVTETADRIVRHHGERRAVALTHTGADPREAVRRAVLAYGGFDVLVDATDSGHTAPQALSVLARQGLGGSILLAGPGRTAGELRSQLTDLTPECLRHGVSVHAMTDASEDALLAATLFFTGPAAGAWRGTVLEPAATTTGAEAS
ncbi:class II aldolase/adducin family protein [Streptomyces sp. NPDC002343]